MPSPTLNVLDIDLDAFLFRHGSSPFNRKMIHPWGYHRFDRTERLLQAVNPQNFAALAD